VTTRTTADEPCRIANRSPQKIECLQSGRMTFTLNPPSVRFCSPMLPP